MKTNELSHNRYVSCSQNIGCITDPLTIIYFLKSCLRGIDVIDLAKTDIRTSIKVTVQVLKDAFVHTSINAVTSVVLSLT